MFFEEFIEQHRIDLVIAYAVGFAFLVHCYQRRIHLCYFFSNQAKLGRAGLVVLVVEAHRFKRKNRFTGLAHRANILLESLRGGVGTKLAGGCIYQHEVRVCDSTTDDVADVAAVAHVLACHEVADTDHVVGLVTLSPARTPRAMLSSPLVLLSRAALPTATLLLPLMLLKSAAFPVAVFVTPVVFPLSAPEPNAVLASPSMLSASAVLPTAVFEPPVVLLKSAERPTAVLLLPVVLLESAKAPVAVLNAPSVSL